MSAASLSRRWANTRLRTQIWLWRHGWVWPLVLVLMCSAGAAHWIERHLSVDSQVIADRLALLDTQRAQVINTAPPATEASAERATLQTLEEITFAEAQISDVVRRIYEAATTHELKVLQTEFRTNQQGFGGLRQQQMVLPVQASYPQFKAFLVNLVRQFPGLSIDQIAIKREAVSQSQPEIRVTLSIWVDPQKELPAVAEDGSEGRP